MKEIYTGLYVGNEHDYEYNVRGRDNWRVVHACKEPYHRKLLGYKTRGAPKNHPEYLMATRGNRLYLNLVDANDPSYIKKTIIDKALNFINEGLASGKKVLVHCNRGESRSPSIGLLYLAVYTDSLTVESFNEAEKSFKQIYPYYNPGNGMRRFIINHWDEYVNSKTD